MKKIKLLVFSLIIGLSLLVGAGTTQAQLGLLPFGGLVSARTECTCSSGLSWIWFTPLYLGGPLVLAGPLVYSPYSTVLYGNYNIGVSGKWHLGDYVPGVQSCWMIAGNSCVVLPSIGLINNVGTN